MRQVLVAMILFVVTGCGITNAINNRPVEDRQVYDLLNQLSKKPTDAALQQQLATEYNTAVNKHLQDIDEYRKSTTLGNWESMMQEYQQLNKLADAVQNNGVQAKRFTNEYEQAKTEAAKQYYEAGVDLLQATNRDAAQDAYELFQRVQKIAPGYANVNALAEEAARKSVLNVVINPVDYYSRSFSSWGFNNDYIQQEVVRNLKYQLSTSNVRFYTAWEAQANHIYPDRVIDIKWDEMFIPTPIDQSFAREVSKQIKVGETEDKKPIYNTVTATVYVTRRSVQSHGTISCRITEPATDRVLLWDNFPASNNWVEEYATYRGDSRALSAYDWALVNKSSSFRNPSQGDFFNNVFRQVYPQLVNRIRSVTW